MRWLRCFWGVVAVVALASCGDDGGVAGSTGSSTGGTETTTGVDATTGGGPTTVTSAATSQTTSTTSASTTTGAVDTGTGGTTGGPGTVEECFADAYVNPVDFGADYDQYGPTVGSHCKGTNHQDITAVDRVVFLGDSVTVGTPPTLSQDFYRAELADMLATEFGLSFESGEFLWKLADPFSGTSAAMSAGNFWNCSHWGDRNDDLLQDGTQLVDCFPPETNDQVSLVIITSGGNDLQNLTKNATAGATMDELWTQAEQIVAYKEEALQWLTDPQRFPNGNYVIFGNIYEFTDGTGDVMSCDVSGLAGFDQPVPAPEELAEIVVWIEEQYLRIATETGTDMIFMLEEFCGHGFNHDNPEAPCYRGPGTERWFDLTCIHPNPTGHGELAGMFMDVVLE